MDYNKNPSPYAIGDTICNSQVENDALSNRQLAMVYVPRQSWRNLYSPEAGLERGTIFEELDKPLEEVCR